MTQENPQNPMLLEKQCVSLDLAKKLKTLGVKQESLYCWLEASDGARLMTNPTLSTYKYFDQYSAFTVAELGKMLPDYFESWKEMNTWICKETGRGPIINANTEADARAAMLVYLLENKLI